MCVRACVRACVIEKKDQDLILAVLVNILRLYKDSTICARSIFLCYSEYDININIQ